MRKLKLGVVFGGMSTENEVSVVSAKSVLNNLNREKYEIFPIYIDKNGEWYKYEENKKNEKIENIIQYLKRLDVVFPVLHGLYGEDGTIQGLFELLKIPYVGCGVLASSVGMDKVYTKLIFEKAGLKQAKYEYIRKNIDIYGNEENYIYIDKEFNEKILKLEDIVDEIVKKIKFPMFIKLSNSGSSVGINKAKTKEELKKYIQIASKYDDKILVEEGIIGREVECAVLEDLEKNENSKNMQEGRIIASCIGEIKPAEEFYTYDAKYNNEESKTIIPAEISEEISKKIQKEAIKAFRTIDGKGLSRVDFFIEKDTNEIIINEINTLPGFTNISMYPKLFEKSGIKYSELLDKLILSARKRI